MKRSLTRYAWLSVATALTTMGLKSGAYWLTGSVGLLSDALESLVNLVAAVVAVIVLRVAESPPDAEHAFGHEKAEYFSSGLEGALILVAAVGIVVNAIERLLHPKELEQLGIGLAISTLASLINLGVGVALIRAGRKHRSIVLEADGHHLMTDVWTSVGVIAGMIAVAITGWVRLDPIVAIAVGLQIVFSGVKLVRASIMGLLDTVIPEKEREILANVLERFRGRGVDFRAVRTRQAGARRFVQMDVLVPGAWTVERAHALVDELETEIRAALDETQVISHIEPLETAASASTPPSSNERTDHQPEPEPRAASV